jgi:glycosyltransferase involved in cell wall biosynthesis
VRVCLVAPSRDILGGQAIQAERLLRRLREVPGLDVDLLPVNPRLPGPLHWLQRVKYLRTVVTSVAYGAALLRRIPKYDVVHAFSASYFSYLLAPLPALAVARMYGKRTVLNYRSGEADDHLARWRRSAATMRLAHAIVVPSGYLVDVFARFGLRARSIFNFVEIERIHYRRRTTLRPLFLSNRNLEPLYNVACVIRAFGLVQGRWPDARLTIVGDGSERAALEELVAQLQLRNVTFVGKVPPEQMSQHYDAADVYLNSPDIDNMPNSVIEAFAAGLPVVTTNAGGIPYIVSHNVTGLMAERGDHAALAKHAIALLETPGLSDRLASRARAECLDRYVWSAVSREWQELYRSLATPAGAVA